MNPTEIYDALSEIAAKPFNAAEFPFEFALATDAAQAAVAKLRNGSTNKSDLPGGVLSNKKFHYAPALGGLADVTLDLIKASKKTATAKPAILISTDGDTIAALHSASGETLHCKFSELGEHFLFFLPAAGKEQYQVPPENPVDVKASRKLARLYDALIKANPDWAAEDRRHEMNQLMMRLIFCLFAEDVGIFPEHQFSALIHTHAGDRGAATHEVLIAAFKAMNRPEAARADLPVWTHKLAYVNGGLFAGAIDAPRFDPSAFGYFKEAAALNWREINPDIFGSMIQSVADPAMRAELGMHYTSVPNIMKVIGPLFLDDIDADITRAWDKPKALHHLMERLENIRVFDPACGSGNFLVVAYRQLREREMRILKRLEGLEGTGTLHMFSAISIKNFYGIEITDFGAETAKLALFIAEYQANDAFALLFGSAIPALPLKEAANIKHGNSLRLDWEDVCPPPEGEEEVYVVGNPPFAGAKNQTKEQKDDRNYIFETRKMSGYKTLDFVASWMIKSFEYIRNRQKCRFALVATSSVCQGRQAGAIWEKILDSSEIFFAYRPFKWMNNASDNAAVDCVVFGVRNRSKEQKILFDGETKSFPKNINGYLIDGPNLFVPQRSFPLFNIPKMIYGSMPNDGGHLIFSREEMESVVQSHPSTERFFRKLFGTTELLSGLPRYCLWISDEEIEEALLCKPIRERVNLVRSHREKSSNPETVSRASQPHKFWHIAEPSTKSKLVVASASSERRDYLPCDIMPADVVVSNLCFEVPDAPLWSLALFASKMNLSWVATVCGKLEARYRFSNSLGWHNIPVPQFTEDQLSALTSSARKILKIRYSHHPKTLADLYDPKNIPNDLRDAHRENDELLETMYIGRPFRNDTERLEHLFKLYAAKIKSLNKKN